MTSKQCFGQPGQAHWTERRYRNNARLLFDVEAAFFQNTGFTRQELAGVQKLADKLGAGLKSPIIDIACGPGRHSVQLAHDGHDVTGLDFSTDLLDLARQSAANDHNGKKDPEFVYGDMRQLEFADETFSSVLLLGNSFGYFSDEDNIRALSEACRVLRAGGYICLEITNKERYLATLEPFAEEVIEGRFFPKLNCEWHKSWDPLRKRVNTREKHSEAETGKVLYEGSYDIRLFDTAEIVELLKSLGVRAVDSLPISPGKESLPEGLGETFGALGEILLVGGIK